MSTEKDDGGPAFPMSTIDGYTQYGMALRDYFAAKALNAILQCELPYKVSDEMKGKTVAQYAAIQAYKMADAMLEAR